MIEGKHPAFIVRQAEPLNGGAPVELLCRQPITPNDLFFTRCHAPIPVVDPLSYRLRVEGRVQTLLDLSLDMLTAFPRRELPAFLQCAGNRRREMEAVAPIPDEIIWDTEAVSSAVWSGVALTDVLEAAGVDAAPGGHVAFEGLDVVSKQDARFPFGGSIPLDKALYGDVLLAYAMNGEALPPMHGYPLRVVVPGYIGARSVKWLGRIVVQDVPSDNYYQARAYRLFPGDATPGTTDWDAAMMLGEVPVVSIIGTPCADQTLPAGEIFVCGVALVGGGRRVERVDVSTDGGQTWARADLSDDGGHWAWRLWQWRTRLTPGDYQVVARAWDSAANTQPERVESVWNFKGYMNNAQHRVRVHVE